MNHVSRWLSSPPLLRALSCTARVSRCRYEHERIISRGAVLDLTNEVNNLRKDMRTLSP